MTFAAPLWLLALLLVPAFVRALWHRRRPSGVRHSSVRVAALTSPTGWARLHNLPAVLLVGAFVLGVVALARPQEQNVTIERTTEGLSIVLVLDISTSMMAEDFYPNRFEAAKRVAAEFIDGRTSDRIGLVVFAAQSYTQVPLTLDYPFLKRMLREVRMGLIEDGTAIGTAIATATARLRDTGESENSAESNVIILLTDGQNNRGEIDPTTAAEVAEAIGARIYAIGVGGDGGGRFGGPFGPFFRSAEVDETTLRAVAEKTGGRYFRATDNEALGDIYRAISELETTEVEETSYVDVDERYALFLWPALGLFGLSIVLSTTRLRRTP